MSAEVSDSGQQRLRVAIRGLVQGVGFRPFIYRLATELGLRGWVNNNLQGVCIEVEGDAQTLRAFLGRIERDRPPRAAIYSLESSFLDPVGFAAFEIRESDGAGATTALVLPDIATCDDCLREVLDPADRRFGYPFTNCTNCGPRFSIIRALPYDRPATTMAGFVMCPACQAEYDDPLNRRFHAQPNACPECGPQIELWSPAGEVLAGRAEALAQAAEALRAGQVVAAKGLGGFHLMVDARSEAAVLDLRRRKRREEKPVALMFPSLELARAECEVSEAETRLLLSPESPIVLLGRRSGAGEVSPTVAPGNPTLGLMLPYTPLHHLLMRELGFPVVATSGNLSDEPICTDEREALERLAGIADLFLVHNRPLARHVDDSIVRVMAGRELILRRARGYAPLPVQLPPPGADAVSQRPVLAVGAHLKNAVALAVGREAFLSQHIGDLETEQAYGAFQAVAGDLQRLYSAPAERVACDAHPDYLSTGFAEAAGLPVVRVQHHLAHVLSCMAENELSGSALGVAWDGTGYGLDGMSWGGEFLRVTESSVSRVARFRPVRLPGGDRAIREPRRVALAMLEELLGEELWSRTDLPPVAAFTGAELAALRTILAAHAAVPRASSVGRLFDAVASVAGLRQVVRFEGQAAMELEFALTGVAAGEPYTFGLDAPPAGCATLDWGPVLAEVLEDLRRGAAVADVSARFHAALVEAILAVARKIGEEAVVLSGGCFQNKTLTEAAIRRLREEGFRPYWHQRVPPNDGGIALGQVAAALRERTWSDVPGDPG